MSLQKVIVMPVEVFNSLKSSILADNEASDFDKEMKKILHNKKLQDLEKYELYREKMIHYGAVFRDADYKSKTQISPSVVHVESVGSQTKYVTKMDKEIATEPKTVSVGITQTPLETSQIIPPIEKVFETSNSFHSLQDDVEEPETSFKHNFSNKNRIRNFSPSRVVRKKLNSRHHDIDLFEMYNGDIVTVVKSAAGDISKDDSLRTNAFSERSSGSILNKKRKVTSTPLKGIIWEHL